MFVLVLVMLPLISWLKWYLPCFCTIKLFHFELIIYGEKNWNVLFVELLSAILAYSNDSCLSVITIDYYYFFPFINWRSTIRNRFFFCYFFIYIRMESLILVNSVGYNPLLSLCILMFILSQIWPVELPFLWILCPLDMAPSFGGIFFLFGTCAQTSPSCPPAPYIQRHS